MLKNIIKSKNINKNYINIVSTFQKKNIISLKRLALLYIYPKHIKKLRIKPNLKFKRKKILKTKRILRKKQFKRLTLLKNFLISKRPFIYHHTLRLKELNYKKNLRWKLRDFNFLYRKSFSKSFLKLKNLYKIQYKFFNFKNYSINFISFFKEFFFSLDFSNFIISFNLKKISFLFYNIYFSFINIWFLLKNLINVYYILFYFENKIKYIEKNVSILFYLFKYEAYLKSFLNFRIPKVTTRIKEFILKLRITHSNLFFTVLDSVSLNTLFHGSGGFYNSNKKIIERKLRLNIKRKKKLRRDIPNKLENKNLNINEEEPENKKKIKKFITKSKKHEKRKTKRLASIKKRKKWIRKTSNTSFDHLFKLILKTFKRYKYNQIRFWILSLNSLKYSFWKNMYKRWKPSRYSKYKNKNNKKYYNNFKNKTFLISSSLWFQFKLAHNGMRYKKSRRL